MIRSTPTINELIAGSVGGAAQVLVGQPLDTIKTRAQIAPSKSPNGPLRPKCTDILGLFRRHVCECGGQWLRLGLILV